MPNNIYLKFLFQFLSWLLFFQIVRLVFIIWNMEDCARIPTAEILALPFQAIYVDVAISSYFMAASWFFFTLAILSEKNWILRVSHVFTGLLIVLVSVLAIAELPIYDEWGTKMNFKALSMMDTPSEVFRTATDQQLVFGAMAMAGLSLTGIWLFQKIAFKKEIQPKRKPIWMCLSFVLLVPALLVLGMRGGFQPIPIQISDAYYSKHHILNTASVNSVFFLLNSYIHGQKHVDKPYQFMPDEKANSVFSEIMTPEKDSTIHVFTTPKPNIVLLLLESWSADVLEVCGGYPGLTPHVDSLAKEGLLFSNFYASGLRSEQGMAAIFSAFPAQPKTSILRMPDMFQHLPCIVPVLDSAGYSTSFLFGGQLSFGNIRSYMYFNGFDRIVEGKDFDRSIPQGKLGVADEYLFERQLEDLSKESQPFFATVFNLSSHSPYDMPMEEVIHWGGKHKPYLNSIYYADRCIGHFMEQARNTDWYDNTVFIFMADHSRPTPKNWKYFQPELRKIPLIFFGEILKPEFRGKVDSLPAVQTDFAATILSQLGLPIQSFKYSHNLFNPLENRMAFYTFDEGFGLMKPKNKQLCWHLKNNRVDFVKPENDSLLIRQNIKEGKAMLQVLMNDYFGF